MNNILVDERFEFLTDLGFSVDEVNNQLSIWCEGLINTACDEDMIPIYRQNLRYIKEKGYDEQIILYLFFVHSSSFSVLCDTFKTRFDRIENELGEDCEQKLDDEFWETGVCGIFELIGRFTIDDSEWMAKMKEKCEEILSKQ